MNDTNQQPNIVITSNNHMVETADPVWLIMSVQDYIFKTHFNTRSETIVRLM